MSRPKRHINPPKRFEDYVLHNIETRGERVAEVKYEVSDVHDRREGTGGDEVLVSWRGYPPQQRDWIPLSSNRGLHAFLYHNEGNPFSCSLHRGATMSLPLAPEVLAIRREVNKSLHSRTTRGAVGRSFMRRVEVPFPAQLFDQLFRSRDFFGVQMPTNGANTEFRCLARDLDDLFGGDAWRIRRYPGTKIVAVDATHRVRVRWWAESQETFDHDRCLR